MNKDRFKKIAILCEQTEGANKSQIVDIKGELETIRDEENDYKESMPESLQNGEKGERADAAIEALETAIEKCEEIETAFDELTDALNGIE